VTGNVSEALSKLAPQFVSFPTNPATLLANKLGFHNVAGFSSVTGATDCTQVAIKAPSVNEEAFVNRK